MDAEFVQSIAQVGSYVQISLVAGGVHEGVLEELTLTRLRLKQPDGMPVAVALTMVATIARKTAARAGQPPLVPAEPPSTVDEPAGSVAAEVAGPALEDALAAVAELRLLPIDMKIEVSVQHEKQLQQIRNSYENAERIGELAPRFHRVANLYGRVRNLWNGDKGNPGLNRLAGAFKLLMEDADEAQDYLAVAAQAGDVPAMRLLAISAARNGDHRTAVRGLCQYFEHVAASADSPTRQAMLDLLAATGNEDPSSVLEGSPQRSSPVVETTAVAPRKVTPVRPIEQPVPQPRRVMQPRPAPLTQNIPRPAQRPPAPTRPKREPKDPYQHAKFMELQLKDFAQAKIYYRQAIRENVKRESAVKDLAWLTRQTDGPVAALEVIEQEFPGIVQPGNALENILIDFLTGARRYAEALELLNRQYQRKDITTSQRDHRLHQIAFVKLAIGQDSTGEWLQLYNQSPDNTAVQRGLAVALIQRGVLDDLDKAEKLIEHHTDQHADGIRKRIAALRSGGGGVVSADWVEKMLPQDASGLGSSTPPLVTYVMKNYSKLADETRKRGTRATHRDLNVIAETARQMGSKQPENSAQAYISAAVLAHELGVPDSGRYLYFGLTTLADLMQDRKEHESARDLYCSALAAADEQQEGDAMPDIRWALTGYLRSLNGRRALRNLRRDRDGALSSLLASDVSKVLGDLVRANGAKVLELVRPVLADTSAARDLLLDAICARPELRAATAECLADSPIGIPARPNERQVRDAWQQAAVSWNRRKRGLSHALADLRQVTISETTLDVALHRLNDPELVMPEVMQDGLAAIGRALVELRRFTHEPSFEERESCLRTADHTVQQLRDEVQRGPTALTVELLEPIAIRIQELIADANKQLIAAQPPQPELSLALQESSSGQNGVVTVQIKVSNAAGSAPLGSPELLISAEPGLFSVDDHKVQLPTAVRGNDHRIESVRLRVSETLLNAGAFSLPVTLRYRFRSNVDYEQYSAILPVRLAREEEFEPIDNPYQDGATGRPVESPKMFFGRDELIDRIRARLRNARSPGIGVAVFGQKRAGKSSIRLHLQYRLVELDHLPVVDVGNIGDLSPQPDSDGTRLLALLMWRILEGADKAYAALEGGNGTPLIPVGLDREKFLETPEPIYDCAMIMENHRKLVGNRLPPLVVLIDEFQYFDQWIRRGLLSTSFMQSFKALLERRLFHLIIVGQAAVDRLIQADPNVFGVFSTERVTYLAKDYARQLIQVPIMMKRDGEEISRYHERAVDQILELTGGSAFYIQRFCDRLVEYMNAERAPVVTEADVEHVRDQFLDVLEMKDFENLESSGYTDAEAFTREDYREMLLAIARAAHNQVATVRSICEQYHGRREPTDLLDDLVLRDVVRREAGGYQIVVRLYQDWLLKYFGVKSGADQP
ncbi:ATP-binding protein [Nocardia sp. NPDC004654]|uniref:ATP-binding protein n=1 Tax=Nocardia sp. NPDC004654 TaxID=3154776 RepID=UPI0033B9DD9E